MIECDSCKEWFHGPCVGITEEESSLFTSYTCIACVIIIHGYDPLNPKEIYEEENSSKLILNPQQLKAFSLSRRVSLEFFEKIVTEAESIPLFFEEYSEMKKFLGQYQAWQ
jgi:PHD-finger